MPPAPRTTGRPPSGNGASSFHLFWPPPPPDRPPVASVSATLTVLAAPATPAVHFWALQADFRSASGAPAGGAHLGLQAHPGCAGGRGANWGGYADAAAGGGVLRGSALAVPSALGCANTGDFAWRVNAPYRLTIGPWAGGGWPGVVEDVERAVAVELRRLEADGPALEGAAVWSEVFADCGDPRVDVRWSDLVWRFADGTGACRRADVWACVRACVRRGGVAADCFALLCGLALARAAAEAAPETVTVNYQRHEDGGCANTNCFADGAGVRQVTCAARETPAGAVLAVPRPP